MKGKFVASARHLGRSIWKNRACYSLMLPGIIWFILFAYGPMSGLLLAFKTYSARGGIWGSPWCGFENFAYVFKDAAFFRSVWTTLTINVGRLLFQFPVPIILALLINECKWKRFNKIAQTIFTFPYFLSWVIVASIVTKDQSCKAFRLNSSGLFVGACATAPFSLYLTTLPTIMLYSSLDAIILC